MKKLLPLLVLLGACTPDIAQDGQPPVAIVVQFDPANKVVPAPNDLAKNPTTGKLDKDTLAQATDTAAQKEFNEKYLATLDGFPFESTAQVLVTGELNPTSVTPQTVLCIDVTNPAAPQDVAIAPAYANKAITVAAPATGWTRGHTYAIALVGGTNGLRGAAGEDVIGSQTWALVSSTNSLVTCPDLKTNCAPAIDVIPSNQTNPAARLAEQTANAVQLEQIRRGYAPILDALGKKNLDRSIVPILWTFSIVNAGEVTFDPANSIVPFPNDVLRDPSTGKVKLPNPKTGKPLTDADCQTTDSTILLTCGLNTLDGFSTLAPPVSENSDKLGAVLQANLDANALNTTNVGLMAARSDAPKEEQTLPKYGPCLNCLSSKDANGNPQTAPQQLQWRLDAPLDEKTTYFSYVTTDAKDDKGKAVVANPVFALARSSASLIENGKSAVTIISDAQASQLEQLRVAYKPMFDLLETKSIHRENLALAFPFTTQSEATDLDKLRAYPSTPPLSTSLPDYPLFMHDVTAIVKGAAGPIPVNLIGKIFVGAFLTPVAITGPGGTLNPTLPSVQAVPFIMSVPAAAPPGSGYPVTLFGHGITRTRNDFLAFANAAAQAGQIVISADTVNHGERTSCTGSQLVTKQANDDFACADPITMKCDEGTPRGLCVLKDTVARAACTVGPQGDGACSVAGQGLCAADSKCQGPAPACTPGLGGDVSCSSAGHGICLANSFCSGSTADLARDAKGVPKVSGWNMFSLTNFFATRDNFRQQVIDLAQLVRVLKGTGAQNFGVQLAGVNGGAVPLDLNHLNYIGQSLGGILGTLFNAVSPDTKNVVLNVPGGALPTIILDAPAFADQKAALLTTLAGSGINPGTPAFDQFLAVIQWILDPADPANMGYRLTHPVNLTATGPLAPPAERKAFIQFIEGDQVVPNISNFALVEAANRSFSPVPPSFGCVAPLFCYEFTEKGNNFDATTATAETRHSFLLLPPTGTAGGALTTAAQGQAATFLATGALP